MAKATAHPNRNFISSEDVQGTQVYGAGDAAIGEIDHLLIDKISGGWSTQSWALAASSAWPHSHYPIPWAALTYDTALDGYRTIIIEAQLRDAPEFNDDSWTDRRWEIATHKHYGAPAYWWGRRQPCFYHRRGRGGGGARSSARTRGFLNPQSYCCDDILDLGSVQLEQFFDAVFSIAIDPGAIAQCTFTYHAVH
jgi:hypothetical protein